MINTTRSEQLKALIEAYRETAVAEAWKGAQPPEDARELELDLAEAGRQLHAFIDSFTAPLDSIAVPTTLRQAKAMMAVASMFLEEHAPKQSPIQRKHGSEAKRWNLGRSKGALPPDPDKQNDDRAGWADVALTAFRSATGCDEEDALGDLLCNLHHWCDRHDLDLSFEFEQATDMYAEEIRE